MIFVWMKWTNKLFGWRWLKRELKDDAISFMRLYEGKYYKDGFYYKSIHQVGGFAKTIEEISFD